MLIELLTGAPPRWNSFTHALESSLDSQPLRPPSPLPDGDLGHAWAMAIDLIARDPSRRPTVQAALQSPLFAPLLPACALSALAAASAPPSLQAYTPPYPPPTNAAAAPPGTLGALGALPLEPAVAHPAALAIGRMSHDGNDGDDGRMSHDGNDAAGPLLGEAADLGLGDLDLGAPLEVAPILADPFGGGADDTPDWLQSAAVDVGVEPVAPVQRAPLTEQETSRPVVEVVLMVGNGSEADAVADAVGVLSSTLASAGSLVAGCELRFTEVSALHRGRPRGLG